MWAKSSYVKRPSYICGLRARTLRARMLRARMLKLSMLKLSIEILPSVWVVASTQLIINRCIL